MSHVDKSGRRRRIPEEAWPEVHRLRATGMGYDRIARELDRTGLCWTTRGSVERLLKCRGAYQGRRPSFQGNAV